MNEKKYLLGYLPKFNNNSVVIKNSQNVSDIMKEVLDAHELFSIDYDNIVYYFFNENPKVFLENIFDFLKLNITYRVESENLQQTKSPSALLSTGVGDCKHYAGFIAGNICAYEKIAGLKIDAVYRFASYSYLSREPGHVFVVAFINNKEIWIDPVLKSFDSREIKPTFFIDKKIKCKKMALQRLSGLETDANMVNSINLLIDKGIMNIENKTMDLPLYNSIVSNSTGYEQLYLKNAMANVMTLANGSSSVGDVWTTIITAASNVLSTIFGGNKTSTPAQSCPICPVPTPALTVALPYMAITAIVGYILGKKNFL